MSFAANPPFAPMDDAIAPAAISRLLLWIIVALSLLLFVWAALAKVDEVASAQGHVVPQRQLQIVSNLEGGVVKTILVKAGATVVAGQALVELDSSQFAAEMGRSSEEHDTLAARSARLQAEISGRAPRFPSGLGSSAPQLLATERTLHNARIADLAAATSVEQAKVEQARRALGEAEVDAATRAEGASLADREVAMIAPLAEKGLVSKIQLIRTQSAQSQAHGLAGTSQIAVSRARAAVTEAQSSLRSLRDRYRVQASEQLSQTRGELAGQARILPAQQDKLSRTIVRAPVAGTINRVLVATIGGSVRPGESLVEIVPQGDALVVEAQVKPADIAFIHLGQRASVKLTAYDYTVYGALAGVVQHISPDAIVNDRTGETHYAIRIRTRNASLKAQDGSPLSVGAGMMAEVDFIGHKRTILSYILTPISKLRENAFREQ
jgi:membrane fusion protein, adhesin transport system